MLATAENLRPYLGKDIVETTDTFDLSGNQGDRPRRPVIGESMAELLDNVGCLPLLYRSESTASKGAVRNEPP